MRTPIYSYHETHSKKIISLFGWELPLQYTSVIKEHKAVRASAGLFDVSHMGKVLVAAAPPDLSRITVSNLPGSAGICKYTHVVDVQGRIIDDVIFTCLRPNHYLCVGNAARTDRLLEWFVSRFGGDRVTDITTQIVCLAIQGPGSSEVLQSILRTPIVDLAPFHGSFVELATDVVEPPVEVQGWDSTRAVLGMRGKGGEVYMTRTGYTGENGFEIFAVSDLGLAIWHALLEPRGGLSVVPVGLGARDTLRLEKGYLLSGHDFDGRQTPLETGYEWLIDWDHDFAGRGVLLQLKERGNYARLMGVKLLDGAIPRRGAGVYKGRELVGELTSASFSPSLEVGIGLGYLSAEAAKAGVQVDVDIRKKRHPAEVVRPPFVKRKSS